MFQETIIIIVLKFEKWAILRDYCDFRKSTCSTDAKKKKKYFKWTPLFNALRNIKGEETSILNSEMRLAFKAHFWVWKQQSLFLEEEHYLLAWARYAIIIREIKSLSRDA